MVNMIENLEGNTKEFAKHCLNNQSKEQLDADIKSIRHDEQECDEWDISPNQWLEAKKATIHELLRNKARQ